MLLAPSQALLFLTHSYDYIILGGGTAGLAIAARLTEDPSVTVGVIEAGNHEIDNPLVYTPGLFGAAMGSELDWSYKTVPQPYLGNRKIDVQRGKMLGGSSGLNFMLWDVASAPEYDWGYGWNFDVISKGWRAAEKLLKPQVETQLQPPPRADPRLHGKEGAISLSFGTWYSKITNLFMPTLTALGIELKGDHFAGDNTGAYYTLASVDQNTARRSYSASAYLEPNRHRENLIVITGAHIDKVILKDKRAIAVDFIDDKNQTHRAELKNDKRSEIIVSGGTYGSSTILERSGIGKKSILEAAGIDVIVRNEHVGENLHDHSYCPIAFELIPGIDTIDLLRTNASFLAAAQKEYKDNRAGPLASVIWSMAMLQLEKVMPEEKIQSLIDEYGNKSPNPFDWFALPRDTNEKSKVAQVEVLWPAIKMSAPAPTPGKTYLTVLPLLMHPLSTGVVHIDTKDPLKSPIIDPKHYSHPLDKQVFVAGAKWALNYVKTEPLKSVIGRQVDITGDTDESIWDYCKMVMENCKHPVGTCALGTVVDGRLRVKGVKGLRVADASIMPHLVSAHTQATVYGIAERAAEMIKQDRRSS
ncbi:hypothetical protein BZA77DRAFT_261590 [Pyronema omphalodes]|nr:hypothetical protein BZA77DRAFT_261590 [Pyronema omphalodes]